MYYFHFEKTMIDPAKYLAAQEPRLRQVTEMLQAKDVRTPTFVTGLAGSFKSVFVAMLHKLVGRQTLVVATDADSAMKMRDDLQTCLGLNRVRLFGKEHQRNSTTGEEPPLSYIDALRFLDEDRVALVVCDPNSLSKIGRAHV